ncbi:hypothetical protein [Bradyrhizobium sp. P5_C11_2]
MCSLPLDLAEATALIEALEAEVWRITTRWRDSDDGRSTARAMDGLIRARTTLRRAVSPWLELDDDRRAAALRDLRVAETAFSFLLRLRSLRAIAAGR